MLRAGRTVRKEISTWCSLRTHHSRRKQALATMVSRYSETAIVMSATDESTVLEDVLCVKRAQLSLGLKVKGQSRGRQCKDGERRNWRKRSTLEDTMVWPRRWEGGRKGQTVTLLLTLNRIVKPLEQR